jgi:hypothetical protein
MTFGRSVTIPGYFLQERTGPCHRAMLHPVCRRLEQVADCSKVWGVRHGPQGSLPGKGTRR